MYLLTWFQYFWSQKTSNHVIIENTRIFCNILLRLITHSIDFSEKADRIVVAWEIFHWVQLKMVVLTTGCKWMVIGQKWVDSIECSRTLDGSMLNIDKFRYWQQHTQATTKTINITFTWNAKAHWFSSGFISSISFSMEYIFTDYTWIKLMSISWHTVYLKVDSISNIWKQLPIIVFM